MNKILLSLGIAMATFGAANAQYNYGNSASRLDSIENALASANTRMAELRADSIHKYVWSNNTYFNVGYAMNSTSTDVYERQKAKFAVYIDFNHNYLFPKSFAWGNMVKVGLNIRWLDLDFAMYDNFNRDIVNSRGNNSNSTWISNIKNRNSSYRANFQQMTLLAGAFGVGPTVTVAPFTFMHNALAALKINLYFHYQPTCGINLYTIQPQVKNNDLYEEAGEKEMKFEFGYVSLMDLGFRLQWRNIGFGVEGRWGSGKLTNTTYSPYVYNNGTSVYGREININGVDESEKFYTRKFGETRIFFDVAF